MGVLYKTENEIIEGINRKDANAYKYLYKRYYAPLCSYASRLLSTSEEVEDVVQELFLSVYEGEHVFSDIRELTNYLYRALYNNCLLYLRDHQIHDSILNSLVENPDEAEDEEAIYALTVREELLRQLYNYIKELPQEQRNIMLLRIEGYEWGEIAEKLGISINTVKTQKTRSYKFLREHMKYSSFSVLLFLF